MALTLAQAAAASSDMLARGVIETIIPDSPFLTSLRFSEIEGNAYSYKTEASIGGAEFRAVNAGYTESTGTFGSASESLVILGGDYDVDRFLIATRSNLVDQLQEQASMKAKAVAYAFNNAFINGDVAADANAFNGLRKRITGDQVVSAGTNGLGFGSDANSINALFDKLDELLAKVPGATMLVTNAAILSRFRAASRRLTTGSIGFENGELGRVTMTYNGIPIVDAGRRPDGSPVIPATETQGSATTASSIYAVKWGTGLLDEGVVGLTNGGVRVDPPRQLETKPVMRGRVEWYVGLALFGKQPAGRLTGVLTS